MFSPRTLPRAAALAIALLAGATACSSAADTAADTATTVSAAAGAEVDIAESSLVSESSLWNSDVVHDIDIQFDQDDYDAMIAEFAATSDKTWISATITIDGETYEDVGLRLKGNSSLFGLTTETAENPEELPWLIRLDKYVDDQAHDSYVDIVIRSNSTETAMNEAVAAQLLEDAGLAAQQAIATTLQVNGGATELRLAMQNPDDVWEDENFDTDSSALYKAESTGDYTYRGDDPDAYDDVFDQEAGKIDGEDDLEPLIDFLEFINNTDDASFAAELSDHLDVESFATYLAFQNLIGNADDIDGRGNNSYLHYDAETDIFTVVNWDLNLAFNTANVGGGGGGPAAGGAGGGGGGRGARPEGPPPGAPVDADDAVGLPATGGGAGGPGAGGSNVLSSRFLADADFAQMYTDATAALTESLFDSGNAADVVADWTAVLATQDVVDTATVAADAAAITAAFPTA